MTGLTYGSVRSGIEAASIAWEPLGWKAAWFSEIEPFPSAVLAHHWPDVPNLGDMLALPEKVAAGEIVAPDVLVGGTPCQAFSVAGNRESLADARGGLTLAYVELADAIDRQRARDGQDPCIVVWENVPGVLSTKDNAFGCCLAGLAGEDVPLLPPRKRWTNAGLVLGPKRAVAWRILDAQYFGLAQRRRRVFVVASARNGFDPSQVLLEFEGVRRDSAPRREAGQEAAGDAGQGTAVTSSDVSPVLPAKGNSSHRTDAEAFVAQPYHEVAHFLNAGGMGRIDYETESFVVNAVSTGGDIAHALNTANNGKGCSEDGTGRGVPTIAFDDRRGRSGDLGNREELANTLHVAKGQSEQQCVAHTVALRGRDGGATAEVGGEVATALRASTGGGDKPHVLAFHHNAQASQLPGESRDTSVSDSLTCSQQAAAAVGMAVRRLTPTECERLQGFPDGHTDVLYRKKPAADGPRYKAIGNSMATHVMHWIGYRIQRYLNGDL